MNRRTFLSAVTGGLLGAPLATGAPQAGRISRVGWLSPDAAPAGGAMLGALRDGLRELGYADGQNIQFEPRWAERQIGRLPVLAEDLVRLKVQVIVAWGYPSIMAAKGATATIPIVFLTHFDPVEAGFVASLARPGGNVTGRTFMSPDLSAKRLQLLREVTPGVAHRRLVEEPFPRLCAPERLTQVLGALHDKGQPAHRVLELEQPRLPGQANQHAGEDQEHRERHRGDGVREGARGRRGARGRSGPGGRGVRGGATRRGARRRPSRRASRRSADAAAAGPPRADGPRPRGRAGSGARGTPRPAARRPSRCGPA